MMQVVTTVEFPHGLRCGECARPISPGEVYTATPTGAASNGWPVEMLVCAACG